MNSSFWKDRKVLITGHTGFKGSWLSLWLQARGCRLTGFSQPPPTQPNLFELAGVTHGMRSITGDIRKAGEIAATLAADQPEIVFHLAAKPLVRYAYAHPVETLETNVMGTVNLLEAVRRTESVRTVVVVTSDKCYENREWVWPYREDEPLGGRDPYACSKACAELVTASYRHSFFGASAGHQCTAGIATARAGNVIGGGDWSPERLVPDIMAALLSGQPVAIRNLNAIRPWQHVLDALSGYLTLAEQVWARPEEFSGAWNFGPQEPSNQPVARIAEQLAALWDGKGCWIPDPRENPHEDRFLKLDSSKAQTLLGWRGRLDLATALEWIVAWYRAYVGHGPSAVREVTEAQIAQYEDR